MFPNINTLTLRILRLCIVTTVLHNDIRIISWIIMIRYAMIELVFYGFLSKFCNNTLTFQIEAMEENSKGPLLRLQGSLNWLPSSALLPAIGITAGVGNISLSLDLVFYNFYPSKTGFGLPGQIVILMMVSGAKVENIF